LLSTPPYEPLNVEMLNGDDALPNQVKFLPTQIPSPEGDYFFVTSMNDVCPKQTEFFQKNIKSQVLNFESKVLNKFRIKERKSLKQLHLGSLSSIRRRQHHFHRHHIPKFLKK
jgi:hypothetical protein